MCTQQQMRQFYDGAVKSGHYTKSGHFFRLGVDGFRIWTAHEVAIGTVNGVEYVDTRQAKQGEKKSYYTDSVSSCCALAARRVVYGPPREQGALKRVMSVKTFLSHVVDAHDTNVVRAALLQFQPNLNAAIEFFMFTMQGHLDMGKDNGSQNVGFSGAVGGLIAAYGLGALDQIAQQTVVVTGYQGVEWNAGQCGVYVRPNGVFPVTSQVPPAEFTLFPERFHEGWVG